MSLILQIIVYHQHEVILQRSKTCENDSTHVVYDAVKHTFVLFMCCFYVATAGLWCSDWSSSWSSSLGTMKYTLSYSASGHQQAISTLSMIWRKPDISESWSAESSVLEWMKTPSCSNITCKHQHTAEQYYYVLDPKTVLIYCNILPRQTSLWN